MEGYNENDPRKTSTMLKQASEIMFAYLYLDQSDYDKYGSIIHSMNYHKSLGENQYPRTIVETNNLLSKNKVDINKHMKRGHKHPK